MDVDWAFEFYSASTILFYFLFEKLLNCSCHNVEIRSKDEVTQYVEKCNAAKSPLGDLGAKIKQCCEFFFDGSVTD